MIMKPNEKGDIGEVAISLNIMKQGLTVFAQVGHGSKVDLVVMDRLGALHRVQCKYTTSRNDSAYLMLVKHTLNKRYDYHYSADDVDVFALYVSDWDMIAYIRAGDVIDPHKKRHAAVFRRTQPKGVCQHPTRMIDDYSIFPL
jgi:hypothetical protein